MTSPAQLQSEALAVECLAGAAAERRLGPFRDRRHQTAVHEAAHCVGAFVNGRDVTRVTISPGPEAPPDIIGYVTRGDASKPVFVAPRGRFSSDVRQALAVLYVGNDRKPWWKGVRSRLRVARQRAEDLVLLHRHAIGAVAERVLELGDMGGEEIRTTILAAMEARGRTRLRELSLTR